MASTEFHCDMRFRTHFLRLIFFYATKIDGMWMYVCMFVRIVAISKNQTQPARALQFEVFLPFNCHCTTRTCPSLKMNYGLFSLRPSFFWFLIYFFSLFSLERPSVRPFVHSVFTSTKYFSGCYTVTVCTSGQWRVWKSRLCTFCSYLSKAASAPSSSTEKLCCHLDFHFMLNQLNCCAIDSSNRTHSLTWAERNGLCSTFIHTNLSTYICSRRVYVICQYVSIFARETMTKNSPNVILNQKTLIHTAD